MDRNVIMEMYVCKKCERGFTQRLLFKNHPCHASDSKQLRISNYSLSYRLNLMKEFNGKRCLDCSMTFASVAEISKHFQANHFEVHVYEKCDRGFMFTDSESLRKSE